MTPTLPKTVGIIWDTSLSMAKRDKQKEFKLLESYMQFANNTKVHVFLFGYYFWLAK